MEKLDFGHELPGGLVGLPFAESIGAIILWRVHFVEKGIMSGGDGGGRQIWGGFTWGGDTRLGGLTRVKSRRSAVSTGLLVIVVFIRTLLFAGA